MDLRLAKLDITLKRVGLRSAARYLNSRVAHRFTTIYRLENQVFRVVESVDKLGDESASSSKDTPFEDSLCRFTVQQGMFASSPTAADARLEGLLYPSMVGSYVGVHLVLANGKLYGSLCHYDTQPQSISPSEYHFLQLAGRLIADHLQQHASTPNSARRT